MLPITIAGGGATRPWREPPLMRNVSSDASLSSIILSISKRAVFSTLRVEPTKRFSM